jgi:predicted ATP-grasp superfamily ATP-dependent carboligase
MKVLLTNAESAKTLACIRALGKRKIEVYVTGYYKKAPAFFSKYCKKGFVINKPLNERKFIKQLLKIIESEKIDILIPVNSVETLILSKYKKEIEKKCKFPFQPFNKMMEVNDKCELMELAKNLKIPIPKTYSLKSVKFPCVFKLTNSSSNKGMFFVQNKVQLNKIISNNKEDYLIQEFIKGQGCGVSYLYDKGKMIAYFAHKRLREFPISGGPSTYRQGLKEEKIVEYGKRILDHVKWDGLAMVEFKKTKEGYKLLEINPRFWGSINQAILSGVNFPYQLAMKALGKKIIFKGYKTNIKTKLYLNDIRSILSMVKNGRYGFWRLLEIFDFRKSDELSIKDIKPFFYYLLFVVKHKRK